MITNKRSVEYTFAAGLTIILAGVTLAGCAAPQPASTPPAAATAATDIAGEAAPSALAPAPTGGPAPTSTPDTPFSANGPWLLFLAHSRGSTHLWAANEDGAALREIAPETVHQFAVRPVRSAAGQVEVAYVTSADAQGNPDLTLKLLTLPDAQTRSLTALTSAETGWQPGDSASALDTLKVEVASGLAREPSLSWSPDGKWLAFGGAQDTPSIDVFSYNAETGAITRLTSEAGHATRLIWTANSRYVVFTTGDCFTCKDYSSRGLWAAVPDGSPAIQLEDPAAGRRTGFIEQIAPGAFLVASDDGRTGLGELRLASMATGGVHFLAVDPAIMTSITLDPNDGVALIDVNQSSGIFSEPGWYLVDATGKPTRVLGAGDNAKEWDPAAGVFVDTALAEAGPFAITRAGDLVDAPAYRAYPSPDGSVSALVPRLETIPLGIWLSQGGAGQSDARQVSDVHYGLYRISWSPSSHSFLYENYATLLVAHAPDFIPVPVYGDLSPAITTGSASGWDAAWTP